jgi:DNA-binding transcriptional ArsR family regulator
MEPVLLTRMVQWLRAAGEPSRLRLLSLCARSGMSVSDLAGALGQSEPRVSRHLKILCEAGLIERERHGQWVHYRLTTVPQVASFVAGLLAQLDRRDELLQRDRAAARAADTDNDGVLSESRLGRALASLVAGDLPASHGAALVVGVTHPELLEALSSHGHSCVALANSRRAAQAARAYVERRRLACRILESAAGRGLSDADVARAAAPCEVILLDRPGADDETLLRTLHVAHRALSPTGRLWLFEGYEALESSRARVVEHPLARLRRLLSESGFSCERISPLEADGEHLLAASARRAELGGGRATQAGSRSA